MTPARRKVATRRPEVRQRDSAFRQETASRPRGNAARPVRTFRKTHFRLKAPSLQALLSIRNRWSEQLRSVRRDLSNASVCTSLGREAVEHRGGILIFQSPE